MVLTPLLMGRGHEVFNDDMIMYANINDQQPVIAMFNRSYPLSIFEFDEPRVSISTHFKSWNASDSKSRGERLTNRVSMCDG